LKLVLAIVFFKSNFLTPVISRQIYYAARARGPEHPCVTGGYMLMADAFTRLKDTVTAKV
jgi:hypothetical protein